MAASYPPERISEYLPYSTYAHNTRHVAGWWVIAFARYLFTHSIESNIPLRSYLIYLIKIYEIAQNFCTYNNFHASAKILLYLQKWVYFKFMLLREQKLYRLLYIRTLNTSRILIIIPIGTINFTNRDSRRTVLWLKKFQHNKTKRKVNLWKRYKVK